MWDNSIIYQLLVRWYFIWFYETHSYALFHYEIWCIHMHLSSCAKSDALELNSLLDRVGLLPPLKADEQYFIILESCFLWTQWIRFIRVLRLLGAGHPRTVLNIVFDDNASSSHGFFLGLNDFRIIHVTGFLGFAHPFSEIYVFWLTIAYRHALTITLRYWLIYCLSHSLSFIFWLAIASRHALTITLRYESIYCFHWPSHS